MFPLDSYPQEEPDQPKSNYGEVEQGNSLNINVIIVFMDLSF